MGYVKCHLAETAEIIRRLDDEEIERMAELLAAVRSSGGRVFFVGIGGGAANSSHAVNDFRKIAHLECYAPTDNVSELTARANDDGWTSVFVEWLRVSRLAARDALFVLSVGGGDAERGVSPNVVAAIQFAERVGAKIVGIVGRDGGYTARAADACVVVPTVNPETVTPHTEALQAVVWHLLVSHPLLKVEETRWEREWRTE